MAKSDRKSIPKTETVQELMLMRMNIQAMKKRICQDLDAMEDRINRMLPPEDDLRYQRFSNYTTTDWSDFLKN